MTNSLGRAESYGSIVPFYSAEATRNRNELTRNPRGIVGCQKRDYIGDIDGPAHPTQGRLRNRERLHFGRSGHCGETFRFGSAGENRVDQNISGAKLRRQTLRDRVDCGLTGAIHGSICAWRQRDHRRNIDDRAPRAITKCIGGCLTYEKQSPDVEIELLVKVILVDVRKPCDDTLDLPLTTES